MYYYRGNYELALASLEKSIKIHGSGDSLDWFFLAMTHWQLGHRNEAKKWFSKGLEWRMDKNRIGDNGLRYVKKEAEALMKM
jgi:hypothetical protein